MNWRDLLRNKWVQLAGYILLGILAFGYFLFAGFPFDRLAQGRLASVEKEAGLKIEFKSLHAGWLFNLVADGVTVSPAARRGIAGLAGPSAASQEPQEPALKLDRVKLSFRPFSLLALRLGIGVDSQVYGGRVKGSVSLGRKSTSIRLGVSNVELAKYTPLSVRYQLNVAGQVNGTVDLNLDNEDASKSTGKIDIAVKNAAINESNPYNIQLIPTTPFEKGGAAVIVLKDGKAEFQDVGLHGDAVDVSLEGELQLRKKMALSQWSAKAAIKMSDSFKSAVPLIEPLLGPGKAADGVFRYRLSGILSNPRPVPDRSSPR